MASPDFVLTTHDFDLLWSDLGLARMPYPLDVPSVGATTAERERLTEDMYTRLAERGLAAANRIDGQLDELLRVLCHHEVSVDTVGYLGEPIRAVAVTDGRIGVLAMLAAQHISLGQIRPTALAGSIVDLLPAGMPGPGRALSLPYQALQAVANPVDTSHDDIDEDDPYGGGGDDDSNEQLALIKAGVSAGDASALIELANNRVAGGQFGVSTQDGGPTRTRRAPTLVTWFDTPQGRYLMVREDSWLSLAPTDNERIARRVDSVLSTVYSHARM
jgi:hypothetical protein